MIRSTGIEEQSFFPILGRTRHDRPPCGQFVVELHDLLIDTLQRARGCSHSSATMRDHRDRGTATSGASSYR